MADILLPIILVVLFTFLPPGLIMLTCSLIVNFIGEKNTAAGVVTIIFGLLAAIFAIAGFILSVKNFLF